VGQGDILYSKQSVKGIFTVDSDLGVPEGWSLHSKHLWSNTAINISSSPKTYPKPEQPVNNIINKIAVQRHMTLYS